MLDWWW